jgi:non-ribosomal peptide synthetase component F
MKYSYFPLQRILNQHPNVLKSAFLDIVFEFQSNENEKDKNEVMIDGNQLHPMPISVKKNEIEMMSKFDFSLKIQYDVNIQQLSCTIDASLDLFYEATVHKIAQRFNTMLKQLFLSTNDDHMKKPVYALTLILLDERILIESTNNTQVLFPFVSCIHYEFVNQTMICSQKLAVELDDQSLTYYELLHYVQLLSLNLLNNYLVLPGEIICQCVERGLSMVR